MKKSYKSTQLFNLSFFGNSSSELLKMVEGEIENSSKLAYIFTPNSEQIVQAEQDKDFKAILQRADVLIPDGVGIVWASRVLAWRNPSLSAVEERITGVDVLSQLLLLAKTKGYRALVIGGKGYGMENQPEKALSLELADQTVPYFWTPGYADVSDPQPAEEKKLIELITTLQPALIFVAFGAPHQEKWAILHHDLLQANQVKLVMVIGGGMDYLTGKLSRAPQVWQRLGLEWLYRLLAEPWRWKRQLRLFSFIWLVIKKLFNN